MRLHTLPFRMPALLSIAAMALVLGACKKEFDTPPERTIPTGGVLTIAQLRALWTGTSVHFTEDKSVYAIVTADEQSGNLYKNVYVQDATGAICLRLLNSGGLYQGDSIRIYLPGTVLSSYNQLLQLDSVDVDNNVVKQATLRQVEPLHVSVEEITPALQSMLISVDSAEFVTSELGQTWADAVNQATVNHTLTSCDGGQVLVRSSGYANFAGNVIPSGNGSMVAIVGQFGTDMQLYVRSMAEVQMTDDRCTGNPPTPCAPGGPVAEDFSTVTDNVDISLPCWFNVSTVGSRVWRGNAFNAELYAEATAYGSSNPLDEAWLISPTMQASGANTLQFTTQRGFGVAGHDAFALFISTNFNGINASTAVWTPVPCAYAGPSTPDFTWIPSGVLDLSQVLPQGYTGTFVVGFRFQGSDPNGQTTNMRLDDVQLQ